MNALTKEQQELCVRWRNYAYKCAGKHFARAPHLRDIIESRVNMVLCSAARTWDPAKGEFKHWVARWVNGIGQSVVREHGPAMDSLHDVIPGTDGVEVGDTLVAPHEDSDMRDFDHLRQRLLSELPARIVRNNPKKPLHIARADLSDWLRWNAGECGTTLGAQRGVSHQRMGQILKRVQEVFERWAHEVRKEAA